MRIAAPADLLPAPSDNTSAMPDDTADAGLFARLLHAQPSGEPGATETAKAAKTADTTGESTDKTKVTPAVEASAKISITTGRDIDIVPTPVRTATVDKPQILNKGVTVSIDVSADSTTKTTSNIAADTTIDTRKVTASAITVAVATAAVNKLTATATVSVTAQQSTAADIETVQASADADPVTVATDPATQVAVATTQISSQPVRLPPTATTTDSSTTNSTPSKTLHKQKADAEPAATKAAMTPARRAIAKLQTDKSDKALSSERDDDKQDDTGATTDATQPVAVLTAAPVAPATTDPATDTTAAAAMAPTPMASTGTAPAVDQTALALNSSASSSDGVPAESAAPTTPAAITRRGMSLSASGKDNGKTTGKDLPLAADTDSGKSADPLDQPLLNKSLEQPQQSTLPAGLTALLANSQATAQPDTSANSQPQALSGAAATNTLDAGNSAPTVAGSAASTANSPLFTASHMLGSAGFGEEAVHHIRWLKDHDLHSAELQLHPAELGRLSISIDIRDGQASVQMITHNGEARELLEQALPELRQLLAQNGMTLTDSQVSQQQQSHQQQQRDGRNLRQLPELFTLSQPPLQDLGPARPAYFRSTGGSHRIDHYV